MNENTCNAFASYGLEILKKSVLLVLYQQPLDYAGKHRRTLNQDTIRKRLGIPKPLYTSNRLVRGILDILEDDESKASKVSSVYNSSGSDLLNSIYNYFPSNELAAFVL